MNPQLNNLFNQTTQVRDPSQRVLTPNFKENNQIRFSNVPKNETPLDTKNKQDEFVQQPIEASKKSLKTLSSHKSFGSFKGKQASKKENDLNSEKQNIEKKKSKFDQTENLSEKETFKSKDVNNNDLIISERNTEDDSEKEKVKEKVLEEVKIKKDNQNQKNKKMKKKNYKNNKKSYYNNYNNSNYNRSKNYNNNSNYYNQDYRNQYKNDEYYYY